MEQYIRVFLFGFFVMFGFIKSTSASTATSFQLPLTNYPTNDVCRQWRWYGDFNGDDTNEYHLADDACTPAGTEVFAVANGTVKYADSYTACPNWGYLIVIEHSMPDGSNVTSVYGHVIPNGVSSGDDVSKGDYIGTIMEHCVADHIHFGIYNGPYADIECSGPGNCKTAGYASLVGNYVDPVDFINTHRMVNPMHLLPYIAGREDATFQELNPFGGHHETNTIVGRLGVREGNPHWWFNGEQSIAYDYGVARNTIVQDYTGGPKEGIIVVHPDSFYAMEIYGRSYEVWALHGEDEAALGFDIEDECNSDWFANGRGPLSNFGLPITGVYRIGSGMASTLLIQKKLTNHYTGIL